MPRFKRMLSSKLEKIHENDEDNYSTNKETKDNIRADNPVRSNFFIIENEVKSGI